jgi:uncharacterized protein
VIHGRTHELRELRAAWERAQSGDPQMALVWGRRRVGKTFLLSAFAEKLPCVFFTATRNDTETDQMARLHEAAARTLGTDADLAGGGFHNLEAALRFFFRTAQNRPLVLILDEAPRLAAARSDFGDVIAASWDQRPANCQLLLVVCGSAVSSMRKLIGPEGGLYRRAKPELRVEPFDPWEAASFLGNPDGETVVHAYAACGGYPLHLKEWNSGESAETNLARLAGQPNSVLLRDALDIMFEDLDFRSGYERVLATMANGPVRRSKIASRAQQRIDTTLTQLQRSGYVSAERPIGSPATADPLYRLTDPYIRFWFSVLRSDAELIDGGQGSVVLRRSKPKWEAHVQSVFEELARLHAVRSIANGQLREAVVGRWWLDESVEIDVLGLNGANEAVLVGEAKWQDRPVTSAQVDRLRQSAVQRGQLADEVTYGIWARHGLADATKDPGIVAFTPQTMFAPRPSRRRAQLR